MRNEFILAVKTETLNEVGLTGIAQALYQLQVEELLPHLQKGIVLGQREALESDEAFHQLLPYIVLTKKFRGVNYYFTYRRGKGVGEGRLQGNVSIGIGGHIDLADAQHQNSVLDPMLTIISSTRREIEEEVEFTCPNGDLNLGFKSLGVLVDNSNAVGRVHLGLVFLGILSDEDGTATCKEPELETLGWYTAEQLLDSGLPLEKWTEILALHFAEEDKLV